MHTFTDTTGRTWELALTIGAAKRVKSLLAVDLLDLAAGTPPLITRLHTDPILLVDVIFALVRPAAVAAGVTDEQFAEALGGDAAWAAYQAFAGELEDFFRRFHRPDLERVVELNRRIRESRPTRHVQHVEKAHELAERETEARIAQTIDAMEAEANRSTRGGNSGNLPESPALTPSP